MKKHLRVIIVFLIILSTEICKAHHKNSLSFVPEGFVLFEKYQGDLNNDGLEDCILIIKGTGKENFVKNSHDEIVDRNRRGIIVLFNQGDGYESIVENKDCFSSENEEGGVYFPPELWIEVEEGNLIVHYGHGRYGYWRYIFKYNDSDFELIGYKRSNGGPVIESEIIIDFLAKKKLIKENTNENAEGGEEIFKKTEKNIEIDKLINLSEIEDFDSIDLSVY